MGNMAVRRTQGYPLYGMGYRILRHVSIKRNEISQIGCLFHGIMPQVPAEIVLVPAGYLYGPGTAEPSNKVARVVMDSDDKLATN